MSPVYASFFVSIYVGVGMLFMHYLLKKAYHAQEIENDVNEEENMYLGLAKMFENIQSIAGHRFASMVYAIGGLIGFPLFIIFVVVEMLIGLLSIFEKIFLSDIDNDKEEDEIHDKKM
ncbi:hypothetical protein AT268_31530 [Bacillus cereus]|uniref:Uncharacterized protein n=1 Tax=Bacillus cereus TaxID=1396 RepID=A0A9X0MJU6_BACCE|nr:MULTISPECIES: hypothetical protein [Bacillus cereus group]KXY51039.1 hypothetical protein AT268_31530 [Bacillus cereus]PES55588.1 hypothetical protein CN515_06150 [Bacillus cereus]PFA29390.1 hypothetical protein CN384_06715 [Bacillus thuringiensis]PGW06603.1 hypothetical protein COD97_26435 [Bacillus cereus]